MGNLLTSWLEKKSLSLVQRWVSLVCGCKSQMDSSHTTLTKEWCANQGPGKILPLCRTLALHLVIYFLWQQWSEKKFKMGSPLQAQEIFYCWTASHALTLVKLTSLLFVSFIIRILINYVFIYFLASWKLTVKFKVQLWHFCWFTLLI